MPARLEIVLGGKPSGEKDHAAFSDSTKAEVELIVAQYVEDVLTQLEAVSRLLKIEELANSLGLVHREARDLVRQLQEPR